MWTDSGSSIFGFDVDSPTALLILNAAILGAQQFLDIIRSITPSGVKMYFELFSRMSETIIGQPLDDRIIADDEMVKESSKAVGGQRVTVDLPDEITQEQRSALGVAIPKVADVMSRDWNLSCAVPAVEGIQIHQSNVTIYIAGSPPPTVALQPPPDATDAANVDDDQGER